MHRRINPATELDMESIPDHGPAEVESRLRAAQAAFAEWRRIAFPERADLIRAVSQVLQSRAGEFARVISEEMGKPIREAEAEVRKCAWVCDYYADHAARLLAEQTVSTDASSSTIRYQPLGAILAVMPWNFPFWQVFRFAAPALMAGNVALLKHASNVPACALAIESIFREAGFPAGAFTALLIDSASVESVIRHPAIQAVTLTGSERAGVAVAAQAGAALKKSVLELGGSDPFIVLADGDPAEAAGTAVRARTQNAGQSCIAAKRFIIVQSVADAFEQALVDQMSRLKVGDPLDPETELGPLAREDLLADLQAQVDRSIASGARLRLGGRRLQQTGWYYAPTVLSEVRPGMAVFDEETFGPVAAVVRASNTREAIELANHSSFGLGASLWTRDLAEARRLAGELETGQVFVNGMVKSDPRLPFGGIKRSGYGRELGTFGLLEFVNIKTVWVR